jgi:hypothetical protein
MLLDYDLDTVDEELRPTGIELRKRVAGRKLQTALDTGVIDDLNLTKLKDLNRKERDAHNSESLTIMDSTIVNRVAIHRATHQFQLQRTLTNLDSAIARSSRLTKTRLDALSDLEQRIIKMREGLLAPSGLDPTDVIMNNDLRANNKQKLDNMFAKCAICSRKILADLLDVHTRSCIKLGGKSVEESKMPVFDIHSNIVTEKTTFLPEPPRECKCSGKGSSYVSFEWLPPVFNGGLPIIQYEISYKAYSVHFDPVSKFRSVRVIDMPNILCSRWCITDPIPHQGFKVIGLSASGTYVDWRVRCYNVKGCSEWTDLASSVTLDPPSPPFPPQYLKIDSFTSSCVYLSWMTPPYDGGSPISHYIINYTYIEQVSTTMTKFHMINRDCEIKTKTPVER